jgi:metallo-beta-lactamase domain protein|nr:MAG TPA: YycJ-like MBL-fold protein [Caudoviricetes sp.]
MDIEVLASGSKGNCYKIKTNDTTLLIECGINFKEIQKKLKFKMHEIDACLITHSHRDHAKAVKDMLKSGIDCYMSYGTAEELEVLNHHRVINFKRKNYLSFEPITKQEYRSVQIGSNVILPFESVHDTKESVNYFILDNISDETLLFITDTAYVQYRFDRIDYLMIECNYDKKTLDDNSKQGLLNLDLRNRIVSNHMSLETVIGFLNANDLSKLKKIYVMHLSDNNADEELIKSEIQKITGKSVVIC